MGISVASLYNWEKQHLEIFDALKRGKAPVDFEVENALLKSARGYYVTVKKPMKVRTEKRLRKKDKDGREYETGTIVEEHIEYVNEQVYIQPQTAAQIFWLKNRKPKIWRDKPEPPMSTEALDRLDEILDNIKGVV